MLPPIVVGPLVELMIPVDATKNDNPDYVYNYLKRKEEIVIKKYTKRKYHQSTLTNNLFTFSHLIMSETIRTGCIGLCNPDSNKFEI